jgi:hypothetical protein
MEVSEENGLLWYFREDHSTTVLEKTRFYTPIYRTTQDGKQVRKSRHLFYILISRDDSGDCVFIEIGPDGYVNRAYHSADEMTADIQNGNLLPVKVVFSADKPPEETIRIIQKYGP